MLEKFQISGKWQDRHPESPVVRVLDYVAGLLITATDTGEELRGRPEDFRSSDGRPGTSILCDVLRAPRAALLKRGAIREAIAAARSVSLWGFQETRAWDGHDDYVIDTGEGSCGVVRFSGNECIGAMLNHDPWRDVDLDRVLAAIPETLRSSAEEVFRLPLLTPVGPRTISCVFWSEDEVLHAGEPWPAAYKFGGELLRRELLDDERWRAEAATYYELDQHVIDLISNLATRRASTTGVIALGPEELLTLLPVEAPHRDAARELLGELDFDLRASPE